MGLPAENEAGYESASALTNAADLSGKLLLIHNLEDDNVHFQNTVQFLDALERAGKPFELMLYPQKAHPVTGPAKKHLLQTMTDFFEKNLK
jgi:dipeptidyl-peptidase-4